MAELVSAITRRRIDPTRLLAEVADSSAGGTVLFIGTVRNRNGGRRVSGLEYQVYREMAEATLKKIEEEVKRKWPVKKISIVHREGVLKVGEVSVAVAVSAQHRAEAFEACRYAIDKIKRSLPLWKKETFASGRRSWVSGVPIER